MKDIRRSAEISECGRYRWWLRRSWNPVYGAEYLQGTVCFVMLNPSKADALQDDPTIRRCINFADNWGFTALSVRNLFPWRATDPDEMRAYGILTLTGGDRGNAELQASATADLVIAAWGASPRIIGRDVAALNMFGTRPIYCLGTTKNGYPKHPLYIRADTEPQPFRNCNTDWRESVRQWNAKHLTP